MGSVAMSMYPSSAAFSRGVNTKATSSSPLRSRSTVEAVGARVCASSTPGNRRWYHPLTISSRKPAAEQRAGVAYPQLAGGTVRQGSGDLDGTLSLLDDRRRLGQECH